MAIFKFPKDHKKHLAAALNLARHNLYITISHISKSLKLNGNINEQSLQDSALINMLKTQSNKKECVVKAIDLLECSMRFLKPMIEKEIDYAVYKADRDFVGDKKKESYKHTIDKAKLVTPATYHKILERIICTLNAYRNQYTHYAPTGCWKEELIKEQKVLVHAMKLVFDGARRRVKTRFEYTDNDMEFLTGRDHYEQKDKLDENGNPIVVTKGNKTFTERRHVERDDFYYRLGTTGDPQNEKDPNRNNRLSDMGLVMFICLFLNKQQAKILIDKVQLHCGRMGTTEKQKHIIFEIFCDYRIKLSRERIESTRPDCALALDMFNELQKCPIELFKVLSPKDQNLFRVTSQNTDDTDSVRENLMVRYSDRFPRLAMAYIDQTQALGDIRFQVALGKYRYKFYNKKCVDSASEDRVRVLQKEINGFGCLDAIEAQRKELYKKFLREDSLTTVDTVKTNPYITDQHAAYKIHQHRIAMVFNRDQKVILKNEMFLPALNGEATKCEKPTCWLSVYELPALLFHHFLTKDTDATATANIIKECVARYHTLFNDIKTEKLLPFKTKAEFEKAMNERGFDVADVPLEIQDYLLGTKRDMDDIAPKRIDTYLKGLQRKTEQDKKRFEEKLRAIGSKDNKIGKKSHASLRPGYLASLLAEDLVKWLPSAGEKEEQVNGVNKKKPRGWNKPTGLNFTVLQSTLALYNGDFDALEQILKTAGIIEGSYPHPFMKEVLDKKPGNMLALYKEYLDCKINYIKKVLNSDDDFWKTFEILGGFDRSRWKNRDSQWYKNLAEKYLSAPIELPRSLFEDSIKQLVVENYTDFPELKATIGSDRGCNIAHLIARFNEIIYKDSNQDFYYPEKGFKRTYKYFNLINNKKYRNQLQEIYLTIEEMTSLNEKIKLENKEQRLIDSITHYRADIQAQKREEMKRGLARSKRDYTDNEKTIRRYKVQDIIMFMMAKALTVGQLKGAGAKEYHLKTIRPDSEDSILSEQVEFSIELSLGNRKITIKQDNLKIKNFGDFFRFVYDGRLPSLFAHLGMNENEIGRDALEKELESYDLKRSDIFGIVHSIEKAIIETEELGEDDKRRINFRNLLDPDKKHEDNTEIMIAIRNAFSHNIYPSPVLEIEDDNGTKREIKIELKSDDLPNIATNVHDKMNEIKPK
ncbi:MAG: type VI-B CRISPR-associated RNA-guided ribonuclease Cas13b [Muribaculaceae bacterium]|nr:type VI-B CRISPR-associated RNA-guided ribonuclease Cas13b [Muribaculaceae bacterium]